MGDTGGSSRWFSEALTTHKDVSAISFTGSTKTGQIISKNASHTLKRVHLEMGGKNPSIIFSDCDFEKAIETTVKSAYTNQGQICLCTSRIFIERSIYEKFKIAFVEKVKNLKQGDPLNELTEQGSVISEEHYKKIKSCLSVAKNEGGIFLTGEKNLNESERAGYFIEPTIIENLPNNSQTNQIEIFGPVACLIPFDSEEEVIRLANESEYGLAACIWTNDLVKAKRVASFIDSGIIWINTWLTRDLRTPFGGMKNSGRGREGGQYILKFFSEVKNICIK